MVLGWAEGRHGGRSMHAGMGCATLVLPYVAWVMYSHVGPRLVTDRPELDRRNCRTCSAGVLIGI